MNIKKMLNTTYKLTAMIHVMKPGSCPIFAVVVVTLILFLLALFPEDTLSLTFTV